MQEEILGFQRMRVIITNRIRKTTRSHFQNEMI